MSKEPKEIATLQNKGMELEHKGKTDPPVQLQCLCSPYTCPIKGEIIAMSQTSYCVLYTNLRQKAN